MEEPVKLDKEAIEDIISLTPLQEGLLYHYLKVPDSRQYVEQLCLRLTGEVDDKLFDESWRKIVKDNEMLRTLFRWDDMKKPVQVVLKEHRPEPVHYDISQENETQRLQQLEGIRRKDRERGFDLREVPFRVTLIKVEKDRYEMVICNHHILYDGWSTGIILKEFNRNYNELLKGNITVKPPKTRFKQFIQWLQTQRVEKNNEANYWRDQLEGFDSSVEMGSKRKITGGSTPSQIYHLPIDPAVKDRLEEFAKHHKVTLAALLYTTWGLLLQKYSDSGDVVFGTTVSGRSAKVEGIEDMVGLFINTLPLRLRGFPHDSIVRILNRINDTLESRKPFESTPLVDIKASIHPATPGELFDTVMVIENYPLSTELTNSNNPVSFESFRSNAETHYHLTIGIILGEGIDISFLYNGGVFDAGMIENMGRHFNRIIEEVVRCPDAAVSGLEIITPKEKAQLLEEFNHPARDFPREKTLHQLFQEQAEQTPHHIALIGRLIATKFNASVTYNELNEKANHLASGLIETGIRPNSIVAIMMERSLEMVIGILGILKSGAAYLPIDPEYPQERVDFMLKDSGAGILLNRHTVLGTGNALNAASLNSPSNPSNLAYIIYTSGTTGRPKGVAVEHAGAVNTLLCRKELYGLDGTHVSLQLFSCAFDGFVTSFFTPLISGVPVVLPGEEDIKNIGRLADVIVKHKVTHFICIPALYRLLIEVLTPLEAASLQVVTLAGDRLDRELLEMSRRKSKSLEIAVEYGVTEASVMSTIGRHLEQTPGLYSIVGKPVWNAQMFVLDRHMNLQPVGLAGETAISGIGLARGYLNNPEMTNSKFQITNYKQITKTKSQITNKTSAFSASSAVNSLIYKTGDLARWLPDGNIEFLGRIDDQVKIRGFRIEPGEIENQLLAHDNIREALVVVREDRNEDKYLCAYVIADREKNNLLTGELWDFLSHTLPGYMTPAYIIQMDRFPLTANGKINRSALPEPEQGRVGEAYAPPEDETEKELVQLFQQVLGVDAGEIGRDDDFFLLGGHSLNINGLIGLIHKRLKVKIPFDQIFKTPSIRELAQYIRQKEKVTFDSLQPAGQKELYRLSSPQERLYFLYQVNPGTIVYNMPAILTLEGPLDIDKLEEAFRQLILRHESFQTSFQLKDNQPMQRIHDHVEFEIEFFGRGVPPWSPLNGNH
ncbi:MAG: amino acid adenylation domain-containing protein, partial [bacterium]|nr:amino acid adenylation domain-containing protein [bacterium]